MVKRNTIGGKIVPAILLLVLVLLFLNKMAFSNLILARGDTFLYFYPYWHSAAEALREMRVPFWNPAIFMGAPLFANSQAGFFYPLNWPLWWLFDTPYAVSASILLHIIIAAAGAYVAARRLLSLSRSASFVTAVTFSLGGYLTAQVEHINQLQGLAWLPWFLVAYGLLKIESRRSRILAAIMVGGLFAMQLLAGHTQTAFISGIAMLIWIFADWIGYRFLPNTAGGRGQSATGNLILPLAALGAGGLLALGLAAIQLLPTWELARYSSRQWGLPVNEVLSFSLPPHVLARTFLPAVGQSLFSEYIAFLPLAMLALAFIGGWQWRRRTGVLPALSLAVSGLFLAFGAYNPLYWLLARLPGFNLFRAPARWLVLYALGTSLLVGFGWHLLWQWAGSSQNIVDKRQFWRTRILPPLILFFVAVVLIALWGFAAGYFLTYLPVGPEAPFDIPSFMTIGGWAVELLVVAGLLAAVCLAGEVRWRRFFLMALLITGICFSFLASRSLPYNNLTTPEAYFDLRPSTTRLMAAGGSPPARMLSLSNIFFDPGDQAEIDSIYSDQLSEQALYDYTIAIKQKEINAPNLPMIYDLASVDGFDGGILPLQAYSQLMSALLTNGGQTSDGRLREHLDAIPQARWLDLFNVRYLITDKTGDLWRDGIYYDRQHPVVLEENESVEIGALPDFEANEIRLLATAQPGTVHVLTQSGEKWALESEPIGDGLFKVLFPAPAVLVETAVDVCASSPGCTLEGLSLIDTRDGTFQSIVPGNYRLIHSGDVKIYENSDVLERAFLVDNWRWSPGITESIDAMLDPDFDVRAEVVLTAASSLSSHPTAQAKDSGDGRGQIMAYSPERVVVQTENLSDSVLVLADANYPGWTATIDGDPTAIYQANGLLRGVLVPEGKHEVIFSFESSAYRAGLIVFILTLGIILIVLGWLTVVGQKKR